ELLNDARVDMASEGRIVISLPADNGHSQAFEMIQQALPALEDFFGAQASWPVKVVLEKTDVQPPPAQTDPSVVGEQKRKRESEEAFIQEVIDMFDGQISNVRPIRGRGGRENGDW
ncbi:hypothetical protein ACFLQ0_05835, partial [Nitrospinota bacterium]